MTVTNISRPQTIAPRTAEDVLAPATAALLVWDMQNGLGGNASNLTELKPRVQALITAARSAGVQVVWSRHIAPPRDLMNDAEVWRLMRKQGVGSPQDLQPYMVRGSHDTEFVAGLQPREEDLVIEKSTPSLFVDTPADSRLRSAGIRTIVMAGVATDIGIEFTARHALALGYFPVVASDAVGAYSSEANNRGLDCLETYSFVSPVQRITEAWQNAD